MRHNVVGISSDILVLSYTSCTTIGSMRWGAGGEAGCLHGGIEYERTHNHYSPGDIILVSLTISYSQGWSIKEYSNQARNLHCEAGSMLHLESPKQAIVPSA